MKANFLWAGVLGFMGLITACSDDFALIDVERPAPVESTGNFPTKAIKVDTTITLRVYYRPSNGCGKFAFVDSTSAGQTATMKIYASYPDDPDVVCADISNLNVYSFRFTPTTTGTYLFKFWKSDTEYVQDTVIVK